MEKLTRTQRAIRQMARDRGISEEDARRELEAALFCGLKADVPDVIAERQNIPCKGASPTADEIREYVVGQLNR